MDDNFIFLNTKSTLVQLPFTLTFFSLKGYKKMPTADLWLGSNMVILTPLDAVKSDEYIIFGPEFDEKFAEIVHAIHLTFTEKLGIYSWSSGMASPRL